jgi:hypothetical protein
MDWSKAKYFMNSPWFIIIVVLTAIYRLEEKEVEGTEYVMGLIGLTIAHGFIAVIAITVFCVITGSKEK